MNKEIYKNYRIYFDEPRDVWVADDVKTYDRVARDPSRKKLLSMLDALSKQKFVRFDVIKLWHHGSGRYTVTSIVSEGAWITLQEETAGYKKGHREKLTYGLGSLRPVTKHNLESMEKMRELRERIDNIELEITDLEHDMDKMNTEEKAKFNIYLSEDNQIE